MREDLKGAARWPTSPMTMTCAQMAEDEILDIESRLPKAEEELKIAAATQRPE